MLALRIGTLIMAQRGYVVCLPTLKEDSEQDKSLH